MPELLIRVPSYIGPSYFEESEDGWYGEWVQGITKNDVEMMVQYAEWSGQPADGICLEIGICDGGSTVEGFNIYNYLRSLGLPIRTRILALAASMAVPLALAADELPEMDYTAQLMLHSATFNGGVYAETSVELRAQADRLDNTNQLLTDLLIARTGQTADVVAGWLSKDTWLTATQAKAVGLCGKVNPLTATVTPVEADTLITARRRRATEVLARRARHTPNASLPAAPAAPASIPAAPMATTAKKPVPRAAVKNTPKAPAARKTLFQSLKELFNDASEEDLAGPEDVAADPQPTELADNNGTLYTDGPLAVDSAVFTDEALTEAAADGEYDTADSQTITVSAGICTALGATPDASGAAGATATTTALAKRLDVLEASLKTERATNASLQAENDRLKKVKPALPTARGARANADAPDAKNPKQPKAADPGAGTL